MINVEQEYKAFENVWLLLGASFKNFKLGENKMYQWVGKHDSLTEKEKDLALTCVNTALAVWLMQAQIKQQEVDLLNKKIKEYESIIENDLPFAYNPDFILVPRVPTRGMIDSAVHNLALSGGTEILKDIYFEMVNHKEVVSTVEVVGV